MPHRARCSCPKGRAHVLSMHGRAGDSVLFTEPTFARGACGNSLACQVLYKLADLPALQQLNGLGGSKLSNEAVKVCHAQRCPAFQLHIHEASVPHRARCSCPKGRAHALSIHGCAGDSVLFTELICARGAYSTPCIRRKIPLLDKFFTSWQTCQRYSN